MHERFVDRKDKQELIQNSPDFKLRNHGTPPKQVVYSFMSVLLAVLVVVMHLIYSLAMMNHSEPLPVEEILAAMVTISILVGGCAIFAWVLIKKFNKIVMETEFQSLIFASSARANSEFSMITNSDKIIVYCDYNFSELFCSFKEHSNALNRLLAQDGLKKSDKEAISKAVVDSKHVRVPFVLSKPNGTEQNMSITVDPISRPAGYTIIRGYLD